MLYEVITWDQTRKSEAGLRFDFKNGGYFQSEININPIDGEFEAGVTLIGMDITGYSDFVTKYIDVGSFEGQTDIRLDLSGNINKLDQATVSGLLDLKDFRLRDHEQKSLFDVESLKIVITSYSIHYTKLYDLMQPAGLGYVPQLLSEL